MSDVTAAVGDLSLQVKVGWAVWLACAVVLIGWYRHARVAAPFTAAPAAAVQAVRFTNVSEMPPPSDPNDPPPVYNELNEYADATEHTGNAVS